MSAAVILDPQTFAAELKAMIETTVQRETAKIPNMVVEKPMNYKEAAKFCGIAPRTLSDWVNRGWVKPHKVGKQPLFFPSEIVAQIKAKKS